MRTFSIALLLAASTAPVFAQVTTLNDSGYAFGHLHFRVNDPDASKKAWVDVFGATPGKTGTAEFLKIPGVLIFISKAEMPPTGGTQGSVVNHVGISVKDYAATKAKADAAGIAWRELTKDVQAFATFPEGVTVEVMEVKDQATPVALHHVHESVPDPAAARAWYVKEFGAGEGSRRNLPAAMFPGATEVDFLKAAMPQAPTKGRALDHIGFEVKNLEATLKKLQADGVTIDVPLRDATKTIGLKMAFITDPNGTYIELTEGLAGK
jgi:catechol 2,3-dioxygenase-like lactoylglutathione lyase family enzyme